MPKRQAPWGVEFFKRHVKDDPTECVPARDFLDDIPTKVAARMVAVLDAVADAPPPPLSVVFNWQDGN